ncbi:hypothetical protein EON64_05440 [archaeon]|nr:MAG: hypothetical protein EON64_05440 [archaeon]
MPHDLNHFLTGVPALFPILENVGSFSVDTANVLSTRISEDDELVCCYGISEKAVALTFGASLLLANRENAQHDQKTSVESDSSLHSTSEFASVQAEIEFEHALSSIAWDTLGNCLAVYDSGGTVHLLKRDGSIAFSKKILPDPELAMFLFVTLDASLQALFSLTTSGQLLCVGNMDTAALCGGSGDEKIQALKSLQLLKWTVCSKEAAAVSKASLLSVGSEGALDMLLAVVDMDGKLTLKELVADGSSTVNDLGYPHGLDGKQVVDIRSLCGKICLLLTSDGTLCALSCQFGRVPQVLQTFYIGDSSLAFKYVDCVDSSVNQTAGFLVAVESKWKIYSFTVLVDTDMDMGYIIPHGYVSSPKQAQGSVKYAARSQHSAYANCQGLCLQSSGQPGLAVVSVQQFSRVSNMLARDIYRSAASAPILDQLHFIIAEGRPLPFGVLLGHIVGCVVRLEEGEVDAVKVEAVLSRILDQRFASEVLLAGHAFWPLLQREFDIKQLFSRLQAAISSPKISKEGVTESHSIVSRLLHHSRLCTSLFSFSPCLLLGSENECATPTYDDAVERLHSVLPSRIGVTVSILLTRGYSHYRDIVLLFQHQVVTTSYPPIIVDGNNAAYATHTTNSWTHSLKQASVSQFFAGVDPCFIVDVPSFLSVCSFVLEAYKQISQGRGEASDDDSAGCEVAVELCKTLYAFVKVMAGDLSKESACKMIIQHALCVLQQLPVCYQPHLLGDLRLDLQSLNEHLILQSALHKVMKVHVSIEDIQSVGWRGFIFEQLEAFHIVVEGGTALCDDVLSVFISNQLAVLTEKFKVDLDVILSEFIVSTFDQLLSEMAIQEEGGQNSPIHEYHATLAKLLVVFKNIRNSALFGYTCLVKMFAFYSYLHNNETIPLHKAAMVALCENFCDTMISALAEAFIAVSKGKERDEVTEALRLYRLRLMARKYAIQDIDLRDNHQLLAAMSIITNHGTSNGDNSVAAGMQFAVQDGNVRVEIASALSRRLVSFASHTSHDDLAYDQKLHGFLTSVPVKSIHSVLEDVLDCLRAEHDDICSQLKLIGKSKLDNSEIHELKVFVDNIAKGIVKLSEAYCDGDYSAHGSLHLLSWRGRDVKNKSTSQLQHTTHRDIFKVMSNYRKLYHLQTAHQIYMLNSDLGSRDTCQGFVRDMVLASVDRFLLSFDQNSKQSSSSACYSLQELSSATDASLLIGDYMHTEIPRLSKVAHLLGVGLAKVVLIVTRRMVEKGKKVWCIHDLFICTLCL